MERSNLPTGRWTGQNMESLSQIILDASEVTINAFCHEQTDMPIADVSNIYNSIFKGIKFPISFKTHKYM